MFIVRSKPITRYQTTGDKIYQLSENHVHFYSFYTEDSNGSEKIKVLRRKEKYQDLKTDHSIRKMEIVKTLESRRPPPKRVENRQTFFRNKVEVKILYKRDPYLNTGLSEHQIGRKTRTILPSLRKGS